MRMSHLLGFALICCVCIAGADEWSVLPAAQPTKPPAAEWKILDNVPAAKTATGDDWAILPTKEESPDKDSATDGHLSAPAKPKIPKPLKPACTVDCACGDCECEQCRCCAGYAAFEKELLTTGKSGIVYVGTRGEDADAARREAKARGLLFMSAKALSGTDDHGRPDSFQPGTHELRPFKGELYFVPREKHVPVPDRKTTSLDRVNPADCVS